MVDNSQPSLQGSREKVCTEAMTSKVRSKGQRQSYQVWQGISVPSNGNNVCKGSAVRASVVHLGDASNSGRYVLYALCFSASTVYENKPFPHFASGFSSHLTDDSFTTSFTVSSLSPKHLLMGVHQAQPLRLSFFYLHSLCKRSNTAFKYHVFAHNYKILHLLTLRSKPLLYISG